MIIILIIISSVFLDFLKLAEETNTSGGLSKLFTGLVVSGVLMVCGAIALEPVVLALGHLNSGGIAFMNAVSPWLQAVFDGSGITSGLHALAEMVPVYKSSMLASAGAGISTNGIPPAEAVNEAMKTLDYL